MNNLDLLTVIELIEKTFDLKSSQYPLGIDPMEIIPEVYERQGKIKVVEYLRLLSEGKISNIRETLEGGNDG